MVCRGSCQKYKVFLLGHHALRYYLASTLRNPLKRGSKEGIENPIFLLEICSIQKGLVLPIICTVTPAQGGPNEEGEG